MVAYRLLYSQYHSHYKNFRSKFQRMAYFELLKIDIEYISVDANLSKIQE